LASPIRVRQGWNLRVEGFVGTHFGVVVPPAHVQRFVFQAHRLVYHSNLTLGWIVIKKEKREGCVGPDLQGWIVTCKLELDLAMVGLLP